MDVLYLVVCDGAEWEDIKMIDNEAFAIEYSCKYPNIRIEIFKKNSKGLYVPTYNFYQNGQLVENV